MDVLSTSFTELAARWSAPDTPLETAAFVHAASHISAVLHSVGGPAFAFASVDYNKKLESLRDAQSRPECDTLEAIVSRDVAAGRLKQQGSLARNLWRCLNAVRFCRELFFGILSATAADAAEGVEAPEEVPLRTLVWNAYESTMAHTHLWSIRQIVGLAMWAVPSRETFLEGLAQAHPGGSAGVEPAARAFVAAADVVIARIDALYPGPCVDENGA